MSPSSSEWKVTAGDLLLAQGWKRLPKGDYSLTLEYTIYCSAARDEDSIQKILQDVVCRRVGVSDAKVMECHIKKVVVPRTKQKIDVTLTAKSLTSAT